MTPVITTTLALALIFISSTISFLLGIFLVYKPPPISENFIINREKDKKISERDSMINYMSNWKLVQKNNQSKKYVSAIEIGDGVYELIE